MEIEKATDVNKINAHRSKQVLIIDGDEITEYGYVLTHESDRTVNASVYYFDTEEHQKGFEAAVKQFTQFDDLVMCAAAAILWFSTNNEDRKLGWDIFRYTLFL